MFGKAAKKQAMVSAVFFNNEGLLGAADGSLYRLEGRKVSAVVEAHSKGAYSIQVYNTPDGPNLVSGGKDGKLKFFDQDLTETAAFPIPAGHDPASALSTCIRSVARNVDGRKVLVGTLGGNILEISTVDGADINGGPLVTGHWKRELHGLATHPVRNEFATVGDDKLLRLWSMEDRKQINSLP